MDKRPRLRTIVPVLLMQVFSFFSGSAIAETAQPRQNRIPQISSGSDALGILLQESGFSKMLLSPGSVENQIIQLVRLKIDRSLPAYRDKNHNFTLIPRRVYKVKDQVIIEAEKMDDSGKKTPVRYGLGKDFFKTFSETLQAMDFLLITRLRQSPTPNSAKEFTRDFYRAAAGRIWKYDQDENPYVLQFSKPSGRSSILGSFVVQYLENGQSHVLELGNTHFTAIANLMLSLQDAGKLDASSTGAPSVATDATQSNPQQTKTQKDVADTQSRYSSPIGQRKNIIRKLSEEVSTENVTEECNLSTEAKKGERLVKDRKFRLSADEARVGKLTQAFHPEIVAEEIKNAETYCINLYWEEQTWCDKKRRKAGEGKGIHTAPFSSDSPNDLNATMEFQISIPVDGKNSKNFSTAPASVPQADKKSKKDSTPVK